MCSMRSGCRLSLEMDMKELSLVLTCIAPDGAVLSRVTVAPTPVEVSARTSPPLLPAASRAHLHTLTAPH